MAGSVMERAALSAGAPDGLIRCMSQTTLQGTQELMRRPEVGVILATGGTGLVRAAYSSGKPAYGVGPGNVPAAIERTADVRKAIADILAGKTFDYGTICSSEQAIVVEEAVRERALEELRQQGAYFLSPEEAEKVGRLVFLPGSHTPNPKIVGRPATVLAEMAGITVPATARALIARLEPNQVGREFPLSAEKLSPILAFLRRAGFSSRDRTRRPPAAFRRRRPHGFDPFARHRKNPPVRASRPRVSRGGEHVRRARLDRLLDESFPRHDARLRRARRKHHLGQYRSAAFIQHQARGVGIAGNRAPLDSRGSPHDGASSLGR